MIKKHIISILVLIFCINFASSQVLPKIDYKNPKQYEIGGITVSGAEFVDPSIVIMLSGLSVGDEINVPGDEISKAVQSLWKQDLFGNVEITATGTQGKFIFLDIYLDEKPRLSKYAIKGLGKSESNTVKEKLKISQNDVVTDNLLMSSKRIIQTHYINKAYLNASVETIIRIDTSKKNSVIVDFVVDKGEKIKIKNIDVYNNAHFSDNKVRRLLKNTKEKKLWRVWKASKLINSDFKKDQAAVIAKYNEEGYRDARIVRDSIYSIDNKHVGISLTIEEGNRFYFRNISWIGNTKYSDEELTQRLKIQKGDVFNQKVLETNLYMSMEGRDIHSLYMDDGYLFFSAKPIEKIVANDSIDIDIIIHEGEQAYINRVTIKGNTRTNDRVIMREIRTKPGQLFSRADLMRTQRELAQLRYFNQESLGQVDIKPNPQDGTVDIEYVVEETSTDQLELSGGWGLNRIVGTLGVSFNNFAIGDVFKRSAWRPVPSGNGQVLSLRAQSNGIYYQAYNMSFTEPWLGGKKPNALNFGIYHSIQTNGISIKEDGKYDSSGNITERQHIKISGVSVGLGKRLVWPDDYFVLYHNMSFQHYDVKNFSSFAFNTGYSNNVSYSITLSRNSVDAPIYPRIGSDISISCQATPPYSFFNALDYAQATDQQKFKWLEYHKWKFNSSFFTRLAGNLVLNTRTRFGFLGLYNRQIGLSPFERFYLGGDGLTGFSLDGREYIGMRGYSNNSLSANEGSTIFNKYTLELRYPLSLNPTATIYMLSFLEAGNTWIGFDTFNPFDVKRSAGVGIRLYMPFFGILGLDWGYGFDEIPNNIGANKGQFHFSINHSID